MGRNVTRVRGHQGEPHPVLSGGTYADDARPSFPLSYFCLNGGLCVVGVHAREMARPPEFGRAVVNVEVDDLIGGSLHDDGVETGGPEVRAEEAVCLELAIPSVSAPLVTTATAPDPSTRVPPRGPVPRKRRFAGSLHAVPGGTSFERSAIPKDAPPMLFLRVTGSSCSGVIRLSLTY